jgi:hypothetical protein
MIDLKPRLAVSLCAGLIMMSGGVAQAQTSNASADELIGDANAVVRSMDEGKYADLWEHAASFVKARSSEDEFTALLRHAHDEVGQVQRNHGSVVRVHYKGSKDVPAGLYANVSFVGKQSGGRTIFEKLSFCFEDDGQWHLTGYVPRDAQGHAL